MGEGDFRSYPIIVPASQKKKGIQIEVMADLKVGAGRAEADVALWGAASSGRVSALDGLFSLVVRVIDNVLLGLPRLGGAGVLELVRRHERRRLRTRRVLALDGLAPSATGALNLREGARVKGRRHHGAAIAVLLAGIARSGSPLGTPRVSFNRGRHVEEKLEIK